MAARAKHKGENNAEEFADHQINSVLADEDRRFYGRLDALFAGSRHGDRKYFALIYLIEPATDWW